MGPIGMPEMVIIFIALMMLVLPLTLTIWALVSCLSATFRDSNNKIVWTLVILLLPIIGAVLYFAMSPKQRFQ